MGLKTRTLISMRVLHDAASKASQRGQNKHQHNMYSEKPQMEASSDADSSETEGKRRVHYVAVR